MYPRTITTIQNLVMTHLPIFPIEQGRNDLGEFLWTNVAGEFGNQRHRSVVFILLTQSVQAFSDVQIRHTSFVAPFLF